MRLPDCVLLGAGGHARVVLDAMQREGAFSLVAILDADAARHGGSVYGVPIVGDDTRLAAFRANGTTHFVVGVGGTGDNSVRRRIFESASATGLRGAIVRHPSAVCSAHAGLVEGVVLLAGAIVNAGARLGLNVIVNTGAVIEHDCIVGDHAHVATRAALAGSVTVEAGAHVGAGAVVRQGLRIGAGAIVGAGAVVVRDVPPGAVVVGSPARPLEAGRHR